MSEFTRCNEKIEKKVVSFYKMVEDSIVGIYKKVENLTTNGYKKIEDKFVDTF